MPIVTTVRKAAKLPSYVDGPVPEAALRREHSITSKHLGEFARSYLRVSRSIYTDATLARLGAAMDAVRRGDATQERAVATVDWFNLADPLAAKNWELLGAALENAYVETIEDAGQGEMAAHGWPIKFQVRKAIGDAIRVPINPFSLSWARLKSAAKVKEISDQQEQLLRAIIGEGFATGQRAEGMLEEIEEMAGLTEREWGWVRNRRLELSSRLEGDALETAVEKYTKLTLRRRAIRIARTETIDAYAQGLDDSWALAKDEGFIDDTVLQKWVELTDSDRTCKICRGLGGSDPVPVGEPFVSEFIGEVERPPAHPHCRCTKVLVFGDEDELQAELARADRDAKESRALLSENVSS